MSTLHKTHPLTENPVSKLAFSWLCIHLHMWMYLCSLPCMLWVGEHRCLNVGWKYCFKKKESYILNCCLHPAVLHSQLKCSHKRKDNCVIHLLALARECVTSHSSWISLLGFEFLWVSLHISDRRHQGLAASVAKRIEKETGLLISQFPSLSPVTANGSPKDSWNWANLWKWVRRPSTCP